MPTKLKKVFESKPDKFGFKRNIIVSCDFDHTKNSIENLKVTTTDEGFAFTYDLTELFEEEPFYSIIDNIYWFEIAQQKAESKLEEVCDEY